MESDREVAFSPEDVQVLEQEVSGEEEEEGHPLQQQQGEEDAQKDQKVEEQPEIVQEEEIEEIKMEVEEKEVQTEPFTAEPNPALMKMLSELDKKTEKQKKKLNKEKKSNEKLKKDLEDRNSMISSLEKKLKSDKVSLEERCKVLQNMLDGVMKDGEVVKLEKEDLRLKISVFQKTEKEKESELLFLKSRYKEEHKKDMQIQKLKGEVSSLNKQIDSFKQNSSLKSVAKAVQEDMDNGQIISTLRREIKSLKEEGTEKVQHYEQLEQENRQLGEKGTKFSEEMEFLQSQISSLRDQISTHDEELSEERRIAIEEMKKVKRGDPRDAEQIKQLKEHNSKLENRVKELDDDIQMLVRKLKNSRVQQGISRPPIAAQSRPKDGESAIMESMAKQNTMLRNENDRLQKLSLKSSAMYRDIKAQLDMKEQSVIELTERVCHIENIDRNSVQRQLNSSEQARLANAKFNKSESELRQLIEKVILENIGLKKENDAFQAKIIVNNQY